MERMGRSSRIRQTPVGACSPGAFYKADATVRSIAERGIRPESGDHRRGPAGRRAGCSNPRTCDALVCQKIRTQSAAGLGQSPGRRGASARACGACRRGPNGTRRARAPPEPGCPRRAPAARAMRSRSRASVVARRSSCSGRLSTQDVRGSCAGRPRRRLRGTAAESPEKSSGCSSPRVDRMQARSTRLRSSRTLPGKSYAARQASADRRHGLARHLQFERDVGEKALDQRRDLLATLAERRNGDRDDGQAIVEVLAERALADALLAGRDGSRRSGGRSTWRARAEPSRRIVPSASTRSSFACMPGDISPASSRNSVPRWAVSKRPTRAAAAPVNAPRSWPNSSLSSSVSGNAAQFTAMNGSSARWLRRWIARAASSLPTPVSPVISTVAFVRATRAIWSRTMRHDGTVRGHRLARVVMPDHALQSLVRPHEIGPLERTTNGGERLLGDERLREEVECARPHGLDGEIDRGMCGQHDDGDGRVCVTRGIEDGQGIAVAASCGRSAPGRTVTCRAPAARRRRPSASTTSWPVVAQQTGPSTRRRLISSSTSRMRPMVVNSDGRGRTCVRAPADGEHASRTGRETRRWTARTTSPPCASAILRRDRQPETRPVAAGS